MKCRIQAAQWIPGYFSGSDICQIMLQKRKKSRETKIGKWMEEGAFTITVGEVHFDNLQTLAQGNVMTVGLQILENRQIGDQKAGPFD